MFAVEVETAIGVATATAQSDTESPTKPALVKVTVKRLLDANDVEGVIVTEATLLAWVVAYVPALVASVKVLAAFIASRATFAGMFAPPVYAIEPAIAVPANRTTHNIVKINILKNLVIFSPPFFEK